MKQIWLTNSVLMVLAAFLLIAPPAAQCEQCCEQSLQPVVSNLNRCHSAVESLLTDLANHLLEICHDIVDQINVDRDRTLSSIAANYQKTCISDEALITVVVQSSQMASQFGDRKRNQAFTGVVKVRDLVMQALVQIDQRCGPSDQPTRVVLENSGYRTLRHLALAIEWIRDYTETNIAVFIKGVLEVGKVAGKLNEQVMTVDAANKERLQRELLEAVTSGFDKIVAIFTVNDDKLYTAVKEFSAYFKHVECPEQAVRYYVSDLQTGIVRTRL